MIEISLCMIVKNEEDLLARCLDSVRGLVDEIVIVDTGSTDRTVEIAKAYTENIYSYTWNDHFADARNFAFRKATKQYCMWMDADDVLLPEFREDFTALKALLGENTDIIMMKYNTGFDANGAVTFSYYRERIIRNSPEFPWVGAVHEVITPHGNIKYSDLAITHYKLHVSDSNRNLHIYEKMIENETVFQARDLFYYARELMYHDRTREAIETYTKFLDDGNGWIENNIEACRMLASCYQKLADEKNALYSLFRSFMYDEPRAEVCCSLGKHFLEQLQYQVAVFWYEMACSRFPNAESGAFIEIDCYGYIPHMQLCVCYYKLSDMEKAKYHNREAGKCKPESNAFRYNVDFFDAEDEKNIVEF